MVDGHDCSDLITHSCFFFHAGLRLAALFLFFVVFCSGLRKDLVRISRESTGTPILIHGCVEFIGAVFLGYLGGDGVLEEEVGGAAIYFIHGNEADHASVVLLAGNWSFLGLGLYFGLSSKEESGVLRALGGVDGVGDVLKF